MSTRSRWRRSAISTLVWVLAASGAAAERPTLKDAFKDDFLVGAAIGNGQILGEEPKAMELVVRAVQRDLAGELSQVGRWSIRSRTATTSSPPTSTSSSAKSTACSSSATRWSGTTRRPPGSFAG